MFDSTTSRLTAEFPSVRSYSAGAIFTSRYDVVPLPKYRVSSATTLIDSGISGTATTSSAHEMQHRIMANKPKILLIILSNFIYEAGSGGSCCRRCHHLEHPRMYNLHLHIFRRNHLRCYPPLLFHNSRIRHGTYLRTLHIR